MFSSYGKLSTEYYNKTKPIGYSIMGDIEYYINRLENFKGKVLEAGVGTGRMLIPLLEKGYDLEGIDNSKEMIDECKIICEEKNLNVNLILDDLMNLKSKNKYKGIIMPTGSFMLIENGLELLDKFYTALDDNGVLIFDISFPNDFFVNTIDTFTVETGENEGIILEQRNIELNWIEQYTLSILKYEKYREGRLIDTEIQEFKLYYYGINELKWKLKSLGFHNIILSSDYNYMEDPTKNTQIITFEAYKK